MATFEVIGYFRDYFIYSGSELKYLFTKYNVDVEDQVLGYYGRKTQIAEEKITNGKKTIKVGQKYVTELKELQGKKLKAF